MAAPAPALSVPPLMAPTASARPLRLIVTTGPKANSLLEISPRATLGDLKTAVEKLSGVAPSQQRLR